MVRDGGRRGESGSMADARSADRRKSDEDGEEWPRRWAVVKGKLRSLGSEGDVFCPPQTPPDPPSIHVHPALSWKTYLHGLQP